MLSRYQFLNLIITICEIFIIYCRLRYTTLAHFFLLKKMPRNTGAAVTQYRSNDMAIYGQIVLNDLLRLML